MMDAPGVKPRGRDSLSQKIFRRLGLPGRAHGIETFEHEPAVLGGSREFQQSLDRPLLVQVRNEALLANDLLETLEAGMILRVDK
jgi:hypothetical protein